ncbi:helix-turn-helix domain-containing protein [Terrimonas rubra]|uniref:Helix-turn-helix domain-containing protein n=1 Tax=Terrimonas rubra TaxID=1035890 RepID=A0ABW6A2P2_9BACT
MTTQNAMPKNNIHEGRNIKRFREMLGIKQEVLAADLGDDWNQQKISLLEQKEIIDPPLLKRVADIMNLPVDAFKNMTDDQAVNIISNTFHDTQGLINYNPTFNNNNVEKLMQLHEQKMALYERMLKEKDEIMARLEKFIERK